MGRYEGIPDWVAALLSEGEHTHVDYKQIVPNDIAKSIAAAANTIALRTDLDKFAFLVGVEEVAATSGVVSGRIVGLVDRATGSVRDIEQEKKRFLDAARQVDPPPDVEIDECATSTATPFFVATVRSTQAPHRLDDRYLMRRGSHTVPLDQVNLRRLMSASLRSMVAEMTDDMPVGAATSLLMGHIDDLADQLGTLDLRFDDEVEQRRRAVEELDRDAEARSCELSTRLDELQESIGEGSSGVEQLATYMSEKPFMEDISQQLEIARVRAWIEFNRRCKLKELPDEAECAGRLLFQGRLLSEVDPFDYHGNSAELGGWGALYQAGSGIDLDSWVPLLDRTCRAAVARTHRGRRSVEWMEMIGRGELLTIHDLVVDAMKSFDTRSERPTGASESALVLCEARRCRDAFERSGVLEFYNEEGLFVARASDCRVEALIVSSGVTAIVTIPEQRKADCLDSVSLFRSLRRRLRPSGLTVVRLNPLRGGRLGALAGEHVRRGVDERRLGVGGGAKVVSKGSPQAGRVTRRPSKRPSGR